MEKEYTQEVKDSLGALEEHTLWLVRSLDLYFSTENSCLLCWNDHRHLALLMVDQIAKDLDIEFIVPMSKMEVAKSCK